MCCALGSFGQSTEIDSLQQLISKEGETKQKVALLNQLSFSQFSFNVEKAGATTQLAFELARKIKDKEGEGWSLAYQGVYYLFSGNLKEAEKKANGALQIGRQLNDRNLEAYTLNQLGNVYRDRRSFDSAFYFYRIAKKVPTDRYYTS
ncbi:MAG: tetratricopeptide repeat protein, partial [Cyclobacteriaceae bacterium]|nr:tetratricopeptide repeat protein [Cyclobacteriaceae bacterium]